jgi:holliday junction DNA helicase RuvA
MIAFLRGSLVAKMPHHILIEVNGIGFQVLMSTSSLIALGEVGSEVLVLTSFQIRENEMTLYGFSTEQEREIFEKLIGISGIGPKIALAALSSYSAHSLADLIMREDAILLAKIPGIGKKTAQRIILELRSSVSSEILGSSGGSLGMAFEPDTTGGAREILFAMGFTPQEVEEACKEYDGDHQNSDELVRHALRRLGEQRG